MTTTTTTAMASKALTKKACRRCGKRKATATAFYPNKDNPDGYRSYCKDCGKIMSAAYAARKRGGRGKATPSKRTAKRKASPQPAHAEARG
jgi:hypothetical protein